MLRDARRPHHLRQRRLLRSWRSRPRERADRHAFRFRACWSRATARCESNGTRIHDQKIATPLGPRWIAWREGLVRSDAGQPAELQCVGRDVTDRTETERALVRARDQADAANRAKSRFLAMASPRNPHAAERHHRHERAAARHAADAGADDLCQGGENLRRRAAVADRGTAGLFQDRGRQDRSGAAALCTDRPDRGHHRTAGAARAGEEARDRGLCRRAAADSK